MLSKLSVKKRIIVLCGNIDEAMYSFFEIAVSELESKSLAPIKISLNSDGGNVLDALAIAGRIKASEVKFIVEVYGSCMSAALAILAVGYSRHISQYALLMHHESSCSLKNVTVTEQEDNIRAQKLYDKIFCKLLADHSGRKEDWWHKICKRKDVYITPEQALKIKLADKII